MSWSIMLGRFVRPAALRAALLAAPVAVVMWVAVVPYFQTSRVEEALPGLEDVAAGGAAALPSTTAPTPDPIAGGTAPAVPAPSTTAPAPKEPRLVGSASLAGIGHRATGTASLYQLPDGSLVIRLEEMCASTTCGPTRAATTTR